MDRHITTTRVSPPIVEELKKYLNTYYRSITWEAGKEPGDEFTTFTGSELLAKLIHVFVHGWRAGRTSL